MKEKYRHSILHEILTRASRSQNAHKIFVKKIANFHTKKNGEMQVAHKMLKKYSSKTGSFSYEKKWKNASCSQNAHKMLKKEI